ncbi:MAG TPA: hypothetical protein VG325_02530 [Solirubrobacteraceae bacterium]|nr:hypothetical protein [Solirubrobacteraceae bacterium]
MNNSTAPAAPPASIVRPGTRQTCSPGIPRDGGRRIVELFSREHGGAHLGGDPGGVDTVGEIGEIHPPRASDQIRADMVGERRCQARLPHAPGTAEREQAGPPQQRAQLLQGVAPAE